MKRTSLNNATLRANFELKDTSVLLLLDLDTITFNDLKLRLILDCDFMEFIRTTVKNQHSSIVELLPVHDVNLGIPSVQGKRTAELRNVCVAHNIEDIVFLGGQRRDGDVFVVGILCGGEIAWLCGGVGWGDA
ncbi:hypothetical protein HG530_001272 [Fusarium avenaceum]|nr:hypothetical protein HG530_001272 [Fusarium avenaceum]